MGRTDLNHKVKELRELRRMADEIAVEIEAIADTFLCLKVKCPVYISDYILV